MTKLIVAGSRSITSQAIVDEAIESAIAGFGIQTTDVTIISGTALGVDTLGERWAKRNGRPIVQYSPDWATYGRSAGYVRNALMADHADALVAIWDGKSLGAKHMIHTARRKGLMVVVRVGGNDKVSLSIDL